MIELDHLEKRYGDTYAVRDLSLSLATGEVTALLGPSGCGKTTTLRMINRLEEPTGGRVLLDGRDTRELRPEVLRREMGYVIQRIGLFPHLSVAQNVETVPQLLGWPAARRRQRTDDLLALVGLEPGQYRDRLPAELSGGQAQRVGVARALAADPPVLLMDEPFGALDPIARERLQDEVAGILRVVRKTVVIVTHDIEEAFRLADRIALMNEGRLVQFGAPDELVGQPASDFVRQFLGQDARLKQLRGTPLGELLRPGSGEGLPRLGAHEDARAALALMLREGSDRVAVVGDGRVVGVVAFRDLGQHAQPAHD